MTERDEIIHYQEEGATVVILLNNPPVNALSSRTLEELDRAIQNFSDSRHLKAAILTSVIDSIFAAGADIRELRHSSVDKVHNIVMQAQQVFARIEGVPKVVIAAINGICFGGGNELAMACDIRVASEKARFGQPEVSLGLMPGWGGTQRLPRLVGKTAALELLLTGKSISAHEAYRLGLVNRVIPHHELLNEAFKLAESFAAAPHASIQAVKKAVTQGLSMSLEDGLELETHLFMQVAQTTDAQEGMDAFLQKRPPTFAGK
jgi:enoyl-CoA hydratase/carnithine racemase